MGTARVGVLDVQSEGENGREFTSEATGIHCKRGRGERVCLWRNVVVVSVGDGMERLPYQVLERGTRTTKADTFLHLRVHSGSQAERKFLFTVINAALGNGAE